MNARMNRVERPNTGLFVIACNNAGGSLPLGRWARLQRTLERARLLLGSPIASFRWAMAKKRLAKKTPAGTLDWQGRRSKNFAQCEQDGIVMGF